CHAWGYFMAEREGEPEVLDAIRKLKADAILTFITDGQKLDDVRWVTPMSCGTQQPGFEMKSVRTGPRSSQSSRHMPETQSMRMIQLPRNSYRTWMTSSRLRTGLKKEARPE